MNYSAVPTGLNSKLAPGFPAINGWATINCSFGTNVFTTTGFNCCLLTLLQFRQFFAQLIVILRVASFEFEIAVAHHSFFVYQKHCALVVADPFVEAAVEARDFMVVVGEKRELQFMKLRPLVMREDVVAADA